MILIWEHANTAWNSSVVPLLLTQSYSRFESYLTSHASAMLVIRTKCYRENISQIIILLKKYVNRNSSIYQNKEIQLPILKCLICLTIDLLSKQFQSCCIMSDGFSSSGVSEDEVLDHSVHWQFTVGPKWVSLLMNWETSPIGDRPMASQESASSSFKALRNSEKVQ